MRAEPVEPWFRMTAGPPGSLSYRPSMPVVAVVAAIFICLVQAHSNQSSYTNSSNCCHQAPPHITMAGDRSARQALFRPRPGIRKAPQQRQFRTNESGVKIHQTCPGRSRLGAAIACLSGSLSAPDISVERQKTKARFVVARRACLPALCSVSSVIRLCERRHRS